MTHTETFEDGMIRCANVTLDTTRDVLQRLIEERTNKIIGREIFCPYCKKEQSVETKQGLISYWGEEDIQERQCELCDKFFFVKEIVEREFETTTIEFGRKELDIEQEEKEK
jgi:C4-type Zn-finger protein